MDKPLAVGFGIGNGEQARAVGQVADGVIVDSALVKRAAESLDRVRALAVELRTALGLNSVDYRPWEFCYGVSFCFFSAGYSRR
jgi:hypothetical protein